MKIFKYPLTKSKNGYQAVLPDNARIIRKDYVDDGFYKGDFLWAIVDPDDPKFVRDVPYDRPKVPYVYAPPSKVLRAELKVKEKQSVSFYGYPIQAYDEDGKLYLQYQFYHHLREPIDYDIAFYKTGMEIDLPIDKLVYLGLCRLWIVQELGLYTFLVLK